MDESGWSVATKCLIDRLRSKIHTFANLNAGGPRVELRFRNWEPNHLGSGELELDNRESDTIGPHISNIRYDWPDLVAHRGSCPREWRT